MKRRCLKAWGPSVLSSPTAVQESVTLFGEALNVDSAASADEVTSIVRQMHPDVSKALKYPLTEDKTI